MRAEAGFEQVATSEDDAKLVKAAARQLHVDDVERINAFKRFLAGVTSTDLAELSEREQRLFAMYFLGFWTHNPVYGTVSTDEGLRRLASCPRATGDVAAALEVQELVADRTTYSDDSLHPDVPLSVHGLYTTGDVMAAIGRSRPGAPYQHREGPYHAKDLDADFFFITLDKSSGSFSPVTQYRDYVISRDLFHWETQHTQTEDTPTVQRYLNHRQTGNSIYLLVRERTTLESGVTAPFTFLGAADYVQHTGSRPVGITWRLRRPLPDRLVAEWSASVG